MKNNKIDKLRAYKSKKVVKHKWLPDVTRYEEPVTGIEIVNKINEIIDKLNKLEMNKEEK